MKMSLAMLFVVALNIYYYTHTGNVAQLALAIISGQYGAAMYIVEKLQKADQ